MKTEDQIYKKLEECVNQLEALSKEAKDNNYTEETTPEEYKANATIAFTSIALLAWVLDMEEQLKPILDAIRIRHIKDKLSKI